ncbi:MAG: response regulator [bacterium]|nr:response regulator [bacterium]
MKHNNILIVDDNKSFCLSLRKILIRKGHNIDIATTGQEALTKLKDKSFNIVILDVRLPDTDGMELIPHFKAIRPDTETIIITAYPSFKNTMQAANKGVSGYFTKPLNIKEVLGKINGILEKQHISMENEKLLESIKYKFHGYKRGETSVIGDIHDLPFRIRKAVRYIEKHYSDPELSLTDIAAAGGMHPTYFSSLWGETTKTSVSNFINECKIGKAKDLLLHKNAYIAQVAYEVGLKPDYFSKVFKRLVGISPKQYRNETLSGIKKRKK